MRSYTAFVGVWEGFLNDQGLASDLKQHTGMRYKSPIQGLGSVEVMHYAEPCPEQARLQASPYGSFPGDPNIVPEMVGSLL